MVVAVLVVEMLAARKDIECFVAFENLEVCWERLAFARFHPPDRLSRKQNWREGLHDLANVVVSTTAGWDPGMLGHPVVVV